MRSARDHEERRGKRRPSSRRSPARAKRLATLGLGALSLGLAGAPQGALAHHPYPPRSANPPKVRLVVGDRSQRGAPSGRYWIWRYHGYCYSQAVDTPDPFDFRFWPKPLVVLPGLKRVRIRILKGQRPKEVDLRAARDVGPGSGDPETPDFQLRGVERPNGKRAWELSFSVLLVPGDHYHMEADVFWKDRSGCGHGTEDASWLFHIKATGFEGTPQADTIRGTLSDC